MDFAAEVEKDGRVDYTFLNRHGEPIERNPRTHPYNYEDYVIWGALKITEDSRELADSAYTDRLYMTNPDKHDKLTKKHFGDVSQGWDQRKPEAIEAFLREYMNLVGLELTMIEQGCNQSTGHPLWRLSFVMRDRAEDQMTHFDE